MFPPAPMRGCLRAAGSMSTLPAAAAWSCTGIRGWAMLIFRRAAPCAAPTRPCIQGRLRTHPWDTKQMRARARLNLEGNMKRVMALTALAAALAAPAAAEMRELRGFTEIVVSDGINLEVTAGSPYAVEVIGADASRVETRVEGGVLRIRQRNRPWFGRTDLDADVRVSLPQLHGLAAS